MQTETKGRKRTTTCWKKFRKETPVGTFYHKQVGSYTAQPSLPHSPTGQGQTLNIKLTEGMAGASERAQKVKVLAAKPHDMSSIPGTYVVEGENVLLSAFHEDSEWHM